MSNIINYNEVIYNEYEKIKELDFDKLCEIISNLDFSNKTVYIIDKLENKI